MARRLKVGLYVNDPDATIPRFVRCLAAWNMDFVSIWRDRLKDLRPGDADVLLLHGGWYGIDRVPGMDQHHFKQKPENRAMARAVRDFVAAGRGAVGVCAGSFNIIWLGLIEADISRTDGTGPHSMEVVNARHPILKDVIEHCKSHPERKWKRLPVTRINGPVFFPRDKKTMVLSYDWEQRMGAVLAAPFGKGRAVAISPHPERTERDFGKNILIEEPLMPVAGLLRNALVWAAGR